MTSWFHHADDGGRDYYDSEGSGSYVSGDDNSGYGYDLYDDDDEESVESHSAFRRTNIISGLHASSVQYLGLTDELWASSVAVESFQSDVENLIVALQSDRSLETIEINWDVLAAFGESKQGRLFRSLGNLPTLRIMTLVGGFGSPTAVHTRVIADALSETSNGLKSLELCGFKISSRSEVEQLARGLKARFGSLEVLLLEDIVLDVEDTTGFLDPILLTLASVPGEPRGELIYFRISCMEAAPNGASVVSPEALGAFFAEEPITEPVEMPRRTFRLKNLGLNDDHCDVMAQELARRADAVLRPINALSLTGNSSIGQQGHAALLGLLNRRFDIDDIDVDDQKWNSTFDLVVFMNREYDSGRFLKNGVFPSKAMWLNFLAELATTDHYCSEMKKLNSIWYTLVSAHYEAPDHGFRDFQADAYQFLIHQTLPIL
jgi:hypothetical protein